jgi:hypothetical protein
MSVKPPGFLYTDTTTPGKVDTIGWQHRRIRYDFNNNVKFTGYGVCLVGKPSLLARHRDELLKNGIDEERQIVVDWTPSIYQGLCKEAKKIGFKGQVICGNIVDVVHKLWDEGKQVDVIDFDDICLLKDYHTDLLIEAIFHDVKVFVLVLTTRGNKYGIGECLEYYQMVCDVPREWSSKHKKMIDPIGKITEKTIEHVVEGHDYKVRSRRYQGRGNCPMISLLITQDNFH